MSQLPNLFIVGAAKSGTTSLYHYLSQHKDIYMCQVKEPHFFSVTKNKNYKAYEVPQKDTIYHTRIIQNIETYLSLFEGGVECKYKGEASPSYLYDKGSAKKIFDFNPDSRIIIILREPVERAFSHYNMVYNAGREKCPEFKLAVEKDLQDADKIWGGAHLYVELGMYYEQVKRYFEIFPSQQIFILKFENFVQNPLHWIKEIIIFLNLDAQEVEAFNLEPKNSTKYVSNKSLQQLLFLANNNNILNKLKKALPLSAKSLFKNISFSEKRKIEKPHIDPDTKELLEFFFLENKYLLNKEFGIKWN